MLPIIIAAIESPEDRDLMTAFYLNYKGRLYTEAWKFMNNEDDASDTVYSALERIIDRMDVFRTLSPQRRGVYAITVVRHECLRQLKKYRVRDHVSISEENHDNKDLEAETVEKLVDRKILSQMLRDVWSELSQKDQLLLEQKYILRNTDEEMAQYFCVEQSSIRMLLTRARRRLHQKLQERDIDPKNWL